MIHVHIDGALMALPLSLARDASEFEELLLRVAHWARVASEQDAVTTVRSDDLVDLLLELEAYPAYAPVVEAIERYGLVGQYHARDVVTQIYGLLNRSRLFTDVYADEVLDSEIISVEPDVIGNRQPDAVVALYRRSLANVACIEGGLLPRTLNVLAHGVPVGIEERLSVIAEIRELCTSNTVLPLTVAASIPALSRFWEVALRPGALSVWNSASDAAGYHLAIAMRACELGRQQGQFLTLEDIPKFKIGPCFIDSLEPTQSGASGPHAQVVLETCARALMGLPKTNVNSFDHVRADGALSFRTQIRKGNPALRLMFWMKDNVIEFANVGQKKELEILSDVRRPAYSGSYEEL